MLCTLSSLASEILERMKLLEIAQEQVQTPSAGMAIRNITPLFEHLYSVNTQGGGALVSMIAFLPPLSGRWGAVT